jgi:hypothetical protein
MSLNMLVEFGKVRDAQPLDDAGKHMQLKHLPFLIAQRNSLCHAWQENAGDYTLFEFKAWTEKAGFVRVECIPLLGPTKAAIAYKPTAE